MPHFVLQVRFTVTAETLQDAREKVEQVITHGQLIHGEVQWEWMNRPRAEDSSP